MKKSLPCFTALVAIVTACAAIAQSPASGAIAPSQEIAPAPQPAPTNDASGAAGGERLLMQAASQMERRASVAARLRHQLSISGQELYGVGSYWQQGSGDELKVRLELQIAGQESKLLQICNSRMLWVDQRLPSGRKVTGYDLRKLRSDPALAPPNLDKLDPGKANWSAMQPFLTAHSGGLPSLLTALRENFDFMPPQAMRLAIAPSDSSQPMNVPVFAVVGRWKPEKLAALLAKTEDPTQEAAAPAKSKSKKARPLPERLPQEVLLLVGQADLFPYRLEYRGLETPVTTGADGPPIPYQLSVHPLVVLELFDVVFDGPIPAGQFDFNPADANWDDQTASLIEKLHRQNAAQVATRPASETAVPSR
jgi:hypothetical protein